MVNKNTIIENVKNNPFQILKFLGYGKREPPKIIERKILEELEKFENYLDIEYEYKIHIHEKERYTNVVYTIGERLEEVINGYISNGEAMRAMIMDKIGVAVLDVTNAEIKREIFEKYKLSAVKEIFPGSKENPLIMQKKILEEMKNIKSIKVNEYFQLYPVKSVAIKMILSYNKKFYNFCEECCSHCEVRKITEEEAYRYFLEKSLTYTKELYKKENIPIDIYNDNMKDIKIWSKKYEKNNGIKGFYKEQFEWIDSILEMKVIKLGRLQFELTKIDNQDEKTKSLLKELKDFIIVNVHIREAFSGEVSFSETECEKSYSLAKEYYRRKGKTFSKIVFICNSWLINPDLKILLSEESNIIKFQRRYTVISVDKNEKKFQIIKRVYGDFNIRNENFPENTTLQKELKKEWKKGKRFPVAKGYFIFE